MRFHLLASDGDLDFTEANLDLAIRLTIDAGGDEGAMLAPGQFVEIAAPDYAGDSRIGWPGCPMDKQDDADLRVADAGLAIDAAATGLGRAMVPALLAEADIQAGRVVAGARQPSDRAYWLIAPLPQWRQKKVKALVTALTGG